jgi:peptidoglycan/xylan/chitin deacetylase (PgdA/CDA1 family)
MIINFHQITEHFDPQYHLKGTWTNINKFERLIVQLKNKFKIIPLSEGIKIVKDNKLKDKLLSITLDDGDQSINNLIPVLKKYNIPATFFINTAYLSNREYSYTLLNYLNDKREKYDNKFNFLIDNFPVFRNTLVPEFYHNYRKNFLELRSQIKEKINFTIEESFLTDLDYSLFDLGLHGHQHERYGMMPLEWQQNDLKKNIEILSSFNNYKPIFAVPYGKPWDWDDNTIKTAFQFNLDVVFHDSGINFNKEVGFKRVPADGKNFQQLLYSSLN